MSSGGSVTVTVTLDPRNFFLIRKLTLLICERELYNNYYMKFIYLNCGIKI